MKVRQNYILYLAVLMILIPLGIWPFLALFLKGMDTALDWRALFSSSATLLALKNSVIVSLLVSITSAAFALPLAYLLARTDVPHARRWRSLFCFPYIMPPYVGAIAWIVLANPSSGLLNRFLPFGDRFFNIYNMSGLVFVESTYYYTFILLGLLQAMERLDPSLEEAAQISGAGNIQVFYRITLPLIMPSLLSGMLLVFLATAASFGVPAMIGTPAGIYLLTTRIYTFQRMGTELGVSQAVMISLLLFVLAIIVLILSQWILGKNRASVVSGKSARSSFIRLGKWKVWVNIGFFTAFLIVFLLPVSGTLLAALSKVQGVIAFDNLTLDNFHMVFFDVDETSRAFLNSSMIAALAATLALMAGFTLAYIRVKTKIKPAWPIDVLATLPYASPGTVLALGMILGCSIFDFTKVLYMTPWLIMLAYLSKYLNFSVRTCGDGLGQIHDSLAEAARVGGASRIQVFRYIWIPLLFSSIIASWFLVFMPAFSELTMSVLLTGPGLETVGTLLFQLQEYGDSNGSGASVLAILLIVFVMAINGLVKILSQGRYGI